MSYIAIYPPESNNYNIARHWLMGIEMYALYDLNQMLAKAEYESGAFGRLAIPIALTTFSLLDLFGFLTRENINKRTSASIKDTKGNISWSLELFFSNSLETDEKEIIIEIYRHGVVHSFFPKLSNIRNSKDGPMLSQNGTTCDFNVYPFSKIFIDEVKRFALKAKDDIETLKVIYSRLQLLQSEQSKAVMPIKEKILRLKYYNPITTTTQPVFPQNDR